MKNCQLGPKFSVYLDLNFKIVGSELGWLVFYSLLYGVMGVVQLQVSDVKNLILYFSFGFLWVLIRCMPKLCKESMYDGQAMLFQSVPVTSFETVLAKMLIGCAAFMIPLLIYGIQFIAAVAWHEEIWDYFYSYFSEQGFDDAQMIAGAFISVWIMGLIAFAVSGICLMAFAVGNHFRGRSNRWKKWVIMLLAAAVQLAAAVGLLWLIWLVGVLPVLVRLLLIMAAAIVLSVVLVRLNVAVLETWYAI